MPFSAQMSVLLTAIMTIIVKYISLFDTQLGASGRFFSCTLVTRGQRKGHCIISVLQTRMSRESRNWTRCCNACDIATEKEKDKLEYGSSIFHTGK